MNSMQHEFNAVCEHLIKQGKPAMGEEGCMYRAEDGAMCAVGCRIPDSLYKPEMEGMALESLVAQFSVFLPPEIVEYYDMFKDMQRAHDNMSVLDSDEMIPFLKRQLRKVAHDYALEIPSCISE